MKKLLAGLFALTSISFVNALEASIDLNDKEIHGNVIAPLSSGQNYFAFGDILYSEASRANGYDGKLDSFLISGGILLQQPINEDFSFKFGGKVAGISNDEIDSTLVALPLGGEITYVGQTMENVFYVKGYGYVAPSIISFGDIENYYELGAQVEYPFTNQLRAYLGFRRIAADTDKNEVGTDSLTVSSRPYIGATFTF